ncbi:MAG: glycosyltransferase family 4 protein [Candidatus Aenigmatarchaeota archaeon]|nr:glycosyltransferase family 4 protein [Candidatus Aenigmarchaeota archaeon]
MKILITHEIFPPEVSGGGEKLTYRIANELILKGYEVKVLTSGDPKIKYYENIETIRIPINRYLMNLTYPIIAKEAKGADLIHTSSGNMCLPSYFAAKKNKIPICCYIHHIFGENWIDIKGPIIGRVFQSMEKYFLTRNYDKLIFQNSLSKQIGLGLGIKENKIELIHPGIDFKKYQIKLKRENRVLFIGNMNMNKSTSKIKGLDYFIEVAKYFNDIEFWIAGDGDYLNKIKKNASKNVKFLGKLDQDELIKLYNSSLILCQPSLAEGFGLSILEGMASGCAIVSTIDIGQVGPIIKPKDINDLKDGLNVYINNKRLAEKHGKKNRLIAKKFTWKKYIDDLIKIYDNIIQKK